MESPTLPSFDELPNFKNFNGCAWGLWGDDDQLGTVNLLTDAVVRQACLEEVRTGKTVSLNWPLNFPEKPTFERMTPQIVSKPREPGGTARDDEIHINTQSGTQWDGLKHLGVIEHGVYYNNTASLTLPLGQSLVFDLTDVDPGLVKLGIHNWAKHGICGRGIFLDLVRYHESKSGALPYDPWSTHGFTAHELQSCAEAQGVEFRQADILIIRAGFMQKYNASTREDRVALAEKPETFAGIEQSEDMKRFLWNHHFAAIASDQPALESWPPGPGVAHMHQTLLGLWGMPIGEFFDLEALSEVCAETGRYTFFFTSWPLNILGGCASPPNAAAYF